MIVVSVAPGVARFVDRIGAFLILVGLAGLAVGGVGATQRCVLKIATIATLRILGATAWVLPFQTHSLQIAVLVGFGVVLGRCCVGAPLALA